MPEDRGVEGGARYRRYEKDGFEILVGKGAKDNDHLTFGVAAPRDLWLHAAGYAGSHVIIRGGADPPSVVLECAAQLAAHHSKARAASGKVEVHLCRVSDIRKPKGFPPGKVQLRRWETLKVYSRDPFDESEA